MKEMIKKEMKILIKEYLEFCYAQSCGKYLKSHMDDYTINEKSSSKEVFRAIQNLDIIICEAKKLEALITVIESLRKLNEIINEETEEELMLLKDDIEEISKYTQEHSLHDIENLQEMLEHIKSIV